MHLFKIYYYFKISPIDKLTIFVNIKLNRVKLYLLEKIYLLIKMIFSREHANVHRYFSV